MDAARVSADDIERWRSEYRSEVLGDSDREHSFYGYWSQHLKRQGFLTTAELEELLEYRRWIDAVEDLVRQLCAREVLTADQVTLLCNGLPSESYAASQLAALNCLRDTGMPWERRLERVIVLRADWAAWRLLDGTPEPLVDVARRIIATSERPKRARRNLLERLDHRVAELRSRG